MADLPKKYIQITIFVILAFFGPMRWKTEPIENQFGLYRIFSGVNYISLFQIFDSERRLKVSSSNCTVVLFV